MRIIYRFLSHITFGKKAKHFRKIYKNWISRLENINFVRKNFDNHEKLNEILGVVSKIVKQNQKEVLEIDKIQKNLNRIDEVQKQLQKLIANLENNQKQLKKSNNLLEKQQKQINFIDNMCVRKYQNETFIHDVSFDNMHFHFKDALLSFTVPGVCREFIEKHKAYDFSNLDFKPGDIVIDIGGNVGIVSIYLAKKYPFLKIYAFEPVPRNYENFKENLKLNHIPDGTIIVENKAVTKDGRLISMQFDAHNSGGSSVLDIVPFNKNYQREYFDIESISLNQIMDRYNIENLKLLKIDCEGAEYEILYNTAVDKLNKIYAIRGEFHEKENVLDAFNADHLLEYVKQNIKNVEISILKDFI